MKETYIVVQPYCYACRNRYVFLFLFNFFFLVGGRETAPKCENRLCAQICVFIFLRITHMPPIGLFHSVTPCPHIDYGTKCWHRPPLLFSRLPPHRGRSQAEVLSGRFFMLSLRLHNSTVIEHTPLSIAAPWRCAIRFYVRECVLCARARVLAWERFLIYCT